MNKVIQDLSLYLFIQDKGQEILKCQVRPRYCISTFLDRGTWVRLFLLDTLVIGTRMFPDKDEDCGLKTTQVPLKGEGEI